MPEWRRLGEGAFNKVYVDETNTLVLKVQKVEKGALPHETDLPERSVRLWNEINNNYPPQARLYEDSKYKGWVCPFISGKNASYSEINNALLDIFNRTGRIVLDASIPGNFKKNTKGNIVCVDIGLALQLHRSEDNFFQHQRIHRSPSKTSIEEWEGADGYKKLFGDFSDDRSNTLSTTIKALLFIKAERLDIFNVDFLKLNKPLTKQLALAYEKSLNESPSKADQGVILNAKNALIHEKPFTMEQLKQRCNTELERYINSRGSLSTEGKFSPSFRTRLFRDQVLTTRKVELAKELRRDIGAAETAEDINSILDRMRKNTEKKQLISDEFLGTINKCSFIVANCSVFNLTSVPHIEM